MNRPITFPQSARHWLFPQVFSKPSRNLETFLAAFVYAKADGKLRIAFMFASISGATVHGTIVSAVLQTALRLIYRFRNS
jgi:hypothetical protein